MSKSKVPTATNTISNIKNADKENVSSSSLFDQQVMNYIIIYNINYFFFFFFLYYFFFI